MSSSGSDFNPVNQVRFFKQFYDGLGGALVAGIGGVISTFFIGLALLTDAGRKLITEPLNALAGGVADFMDGLVGGAGSIVQQGAATAVTSIAPGATWAIGPLTYALSIVTIGVGLFVLAKILEQDETSNILPFTFTDLPLVGTEEEGEEED